MQQSHRLALLLFIVLSAGQARAGKGAAGNGTCASHYTNLMAQLSTLRLSNSSNAQANSSVLARGHGDALHPEKQQSACQWQHSTRKKAPAVVQSGSQALATKKMNPQQRRKPCRGPGLHSPMVCHSNTHNATKMPWHGGDRQVCRADRGKRRESRPQPQYCRKPRGYVLETRRQYKRRRAQQGYVTPLNSTNFATIQADCGGHYRLAEAVDVNKTGVHLPLCATFSGTFKSGGHELSHIVGTEPLFASVADAQIDMQVERGDLRFLSQPTDELGLMSLLANRLSGHNRLTLSGGPVDMFGLDVAPFGQIDNGTHILRQTALHCSMDGDSVTAGGLIRVWDADTILTQTACNFQVIGYITAGGVGIFVGDRLILTQTNVSATLIPVHHMLNSAGGGVARLYTGDVVLTQTAVDIYVNRQISKEVLPGAAIAYARTGSRVTLRLFSGTSNVAACGGIDRNVTVTGVIDTAGYAANATSCQQGNHSQLRLLDTTQPEQWRQAHRAFCYNSEVPPAAGCVQKTDSCHYPHEQLLAAVTVGKGCSALLISRQRYPYNSSADATGLLRISAVRLDDGTAAVDPLFAGDGQGTLLLTPGDHHQQLLPGRVVLATTNDKASHLTRCDAAVALFTLPPWRYRMYQPVALPCIWHRPH